MSQPVDTKNPYPIRIRAVCPDCGTKMEINVYRLSRSGSKIRMIIDAGFLLVLVFLIAVSIGQLIKELL